MSRRKRREPLENVRVLCEKDSTLHSARLLVERIRNSRQLDETQLNYLCSMLRLSRSTANWLASLDPKDRARLRIASNKTVDSIISDGLTWLGYREATRIITNTFIVLPAVFGTMPADIEFSKKWETGETSILGMNASAFRGINHTAIVFENCDILSVGSKSPDTKVTLYKPKGEIVLLRNFPQQDGWYHNVDDPEIICPQGEKRYVRRFSPGAWFGPIARSPYKVSGNSWVQRPKHEGKKKDKRSIYIGWDPFSSRFGSLVECPEADGIKQPIEILNPFLPPEEPSLPPLPRPRVRELSPEKRSEIRRTVQGLTMEFMLNPESMASSDYMLVGGLANIAKNNPKLQREIQQDVGLFSHWQHLQSGAQVTLDEWHRTFTRICSAFGAAPQKKEP